MIKSSVVNCFRSIHLPEFVRPKSIGGYFDLELPRENTSYMHENAFYYQSARAAFRSLLQAGKPQRVWLPKYICDAMLSPLLDEGIEHVWYDLDENLKVSDSIVLGEGDWILYVNYFGVCQNQIDDLLNRFPANEIIFDYSQAFFDLPKLEALATIYSPRKFFGVPDGGILVTDIDVTLPSIPDDDSLLRMPHLLKRLYEQPELGYSAYLSSEESLHDSGPKKMSGLTKRLLKSINYNEIRKKRIENFNHLHEQLKDINLFYLDEKKIASPLCYPFITTNEKLREYLIKNRVFIPTYWDDALDRVDNDWAAKVIHNLLPIPLDQRYSLSDMDDVISLLLGSEKNV